MLENSTRVFNGLDSRHKNSVHETIKESGARDVIITKSSSGKLLVCEYADVYNHYTTRFRENEEFGYDVGCENEIVSSYMGADDYEDEYLYEDDDYEYEDSYEEDDYYESDYRSNNDYVYGEDEYYGNLSNFSENLKKMDLKKYDSKIPPFLIEPHYSERVLNYLENVGDYDNYFLFDEEHDFSGKMIGINIYPQTQYDFAKFKSYLKNNRSKYTFGLDF